MWKSLPFVTPLTTYNRSPFVHSFKPSTSKKHQQQATPPKHQNVTLNQSGSNNKNSNVPDGIPEFNSGFDPSLHPEYTEVRAYSFTTCRNNCSLLTLLPVSGGPLAFKMSVTSQQADAIRKSITHTQQQANRANKERPSTHDLMKSILSINGNIISKAAITHMVGDVFVARLWIKQTNDVSSNENKYFEIDCRPSDALILTSKNIAPLYLNWNLIKQWGVSIKNIQYEFKNGKCDIVNYHIQNKSTHSLKYDILSNKKDILSLAYLKSRLQLAIQLQRFKEANDIQKEINAICPIDKVQNDLNQAVKEQRFKDAAVLMDELCKWKGKLRLWEKGEIDLQKQYYNQLLESSPPPSNTNGSDKSVNNNNNNSSNGNSNEDNNKDYGNHNTFRGLGI